MDSPSLCYEAVHHLGLASLFGLSPFQARQMGLCFKAGRLEPVRSPAIGMSYPPLLLGACLKLSEASGVSAQKERRTGEVGAGAGERLSQRPGQRRTGRCTWLRVGCRRSEAGDLLQWVPASAAWAGREGAGGEGGDSRARRGLGELWPGDCERRK